MTQWWPDFRRTVIGAWLISAVMLRAVIATACYDVAFSTYHGGSGAENFRDVAVDSEGNIYVTGGTSSSDFPTTPGAYDRTFATGGSNLGSAGPMDVFVSKFSPSGQLIWSTYLGGPSYDRAYAIEVDAQSNVYLAGRAGPGFPTSPGALQPNFAGDSSSPGAYGDQDGFIAKISPDGSQLLWASYFGGGDGAIIRDLDVDSEGNIYVVSPGNSLANHPHISTGAYDESHNGGLDAVVAKISADCQQVIWGTYLGGSLNDGGGPSVRADPCSHAVYVIGNTSSTDFPTPNGYDHVLVGSTNGNGEAFLAKLSADGANLEWATFLGGSGDEGCGTHNLAIGPEREVVAAHWTKSTDIPILPGGFQSNHRGGTTDCIIWKFSPDGTLLANTYLGGNGGENIQGTVIGEYGNVHLSVDASTSTDFPTTLTGFQQANRGAADGAFAVLSPDLTRVLYATYIGGSAHDGSREAALGPDGSYVCAGDTASANFPLQNAFDTTLTGGNDGFVARFVPKPPVVDLNLDGDVNFKDFSELAARWMQNESWAGISPSPCGDSRVDFKDLAVLTEYWLTFPGAIGYWPLDEIGGSIAYDTIGKNNGTLDGSPIWGPTGGAINGALQFDGIGDYVSTDFILDPADGSFSVFAWIKGGAPEQVVISQTNGVGNGWSWLCADSLGRLMTDLRAPGLRRFGPPLVSDFVITDGSWHRIGLVSDAVYRYLYADGAEVKRDSVPQPRLSSATGGLYFGAANTRAARTHWFGLIDDIRIYDRVVVLP